MNNLTNIDKDLLAQIADMHQIPQGSYNIRKNGQTLSRYSDADIQIVGKVSDVILDVDTLEITDLVLKKTGFSEQIKSSENLVPMEIVKVIGDKILLKGEDDIL